MKSLLRLCSRVVLSSLIFAIGTAIAAGPEDNFPPSGQFPPGWSTSPGSNASWAVASDASNGGSFSLKSGAIADLQNSAVEVGGTFAAGNVSFAYQVNSESGFDFLRFFVDGVERLAVSGNVTWTTASFPITAGTHVLRWEYKKDESQAVGNDAGWIDTVMLPAATLQMLVNVSKSGTGSGSVTSAPGGINCGGICGAYFPANSSVTLSAAADPSNTFTGWSGACTGTGPCVLSLSSPRNVTATFSLLDDGFPANGQIPAGWTKPIDADAGWIVASDQVNRGPFSLKSAPIIDSQTAAIEVTGNYPAGNITFSYRVSSEADYDFLAFFIDDLIKFSASGDADPTWKNASYPVTAGAHTFKWIYSKDETTKVGTDAAWIDTVVFPTGNNVLTLAVAGSGSGSVTSGPPGINCGSSCSASFPSGTSVSLTPSANAGSSFAGWSGDCSGTGVCIVNMNVARNVTATFASAPLPLTVSRAGTGTGSVTSTPAGINCGGTCSASFAPGTPVTLTASANAGSTFAGWSGDCSGTGDCTVNMTVARNVTATFTLAATSTLTVARAGTGTGSVTSAPSGINCGGTCSASFTSGSSVTLTASASAGSTFTGWSGDCAGTGDCTVNMSVARNVTATFTLAATSTTLTVVRAGTGSGSVTSTPSGISCGGTCSASFTSGSSVSLSAVANAGSTFAGWSGDCTGSGACNVIMSVGRNVTATFTVTSTAPGPLDIDGSNTATRYDPATDGLLVMRYLFGLTGTALTNGAIGATATRTDPATIKNYLDGIRTQLDIDGNGTVDPLTDGLMIVRYLFGVRGTALINRAIGSQATRPSASAIEIYLSTLTP